jgi:hypothetical protein
MTEADEPGLLRYWFEFDLRGHKPVRQAGRIQLDGGTPAYRLLGRGAGVTGYDRDDCLALLGRELGTDLPPVTRFERNPVVSEYVVPDEVGNPAWRGIWFPPLNRSGPTIG